MNVVMLLGRISFPVDIKRVSNDVAMIKNVLAVERPKKSPEGEKISDFIPFTIWGKSAEYLFNYAEKGDLISLVGSLRIDSYQGKDGTNKKNFYVNGENVKIIKKASSKKEEPQINPNGNKTQKKSDEEKFVSESLDEDLPF